jgi:Glycosyltransferase family 87
MRNLVWSTCAAIAIILAVLVFVVVGPTIPNALGFDARAYWGFPRDPLYAPPGSANGYGIYRYSPAFLPLLELFSQIPWPVFTVAWLLLLFGVYLWLTGRNWLPLLAFPPFLFELSMGNIHLLLAAAVVLAFRWPVAWSFVLLSKVTPGVGLLWFVVRREWRALGLALTATAAVALTGVLLAPDLWREWVQSLLQTTPSVGDNVIAVPLAWRLAAAAMIVTWGARTNRRWSVVVAATLGLPTLWTDSLAMLAGVAALHRGMPEYLGSLPRWLRSRTGAFRWTRSIRPGPPATPAPV